MSPDRPLGGRARIFLGMISTVHIGGMRSVHCVRAVFTALGGVAGVARAEVTMGRATLTHDGLVEAGALEEALAPLGYAVVSVEREARRLPMLPEDAAPHGGEGGA